MTHLRVNSHLNILGPGEQFSSIFHLSCHPVYLIKGWSAFEFLSLLRVSYIVYISINYICYLCTSWFESLNFHGGACPMQLADIYELARDAAMESLVLHLWSCTKVTYFGAICAFTVMSLAYCKQTEQERSPKKCGDKYHTREDMTSTKVLGCSGWISVTRDAFPALCGGVWSPCFVLGTGVSFKFWDCQFC